MEERRYVVCFNEEERRKDAHDREAIVTHLRQQLKHGDKSLVGNKGYRRYLQAGGGRHFAVDEERIWEEARFDGKWVLRTNTDYPAATVALQYKQLWMVEEMFRTMKSILETRPIYHKCDETIRGHVFCSFLALLLKAELEKRLRGTRRGVGMGGGRCADWTTCRKWRPSSAAGATCCAVSYRPRAQSHPRDRRGGSAHDPGGVRCQSA